MAGETSAELTIVVRAQDAATRVIRTIGQTVGRVLLAPLKFVGKAVGDIFKQFFGLKGLLLGGGFIAALKGISTNLAKNAKDFEAVFSDNVQARIDATATAFNKLGASLKATFGNLVAEMRLDETLNDISNWLQTNQGTIVQSFRDIRDAIVQAATALKGFFDGSSSGVGAEEIKRRSELAAEIRRRRASASEAEILEQIGALNRPLQAAGLEPYNPGVMFGPPAPEPDQIADWSKFADNVFAAHDAVRQLRAESRPAATATEAFVSAQTQAAPIVAEVTKAVEAQSEAVAKVAVEIDKAQDIIAEYLSVAEFADIAASNITDGFEDLVTGAASVGQAFAGMVSTILRELGRLLLYRSLLNLITGAFSFGGAASASGGGAFTSESGFGGLTGTALAAGGTVRRAGTFRVGENGPETVTLPPGSRVDPANRSRGDGGPTVNVYGARDPAATAREVAAEMRRSRSLRRAFA